MQCANEMIILQPPYTYAHVQACYNASDGKALTNTLNALLLTTLALQAYRMEHGAFPTTLTALVPAYLPEIPDDPFARAGSLHYRLYGQKYLLYSIGPDGKDDGGRPIENPTATSANRYQVMPYQAAPPWHTADGDIVAGVNLN